MMNLKLWIATVFCVVGFTGFSMAEDSWPAFEGDLKWQVFDSSKEPSPQIQEELKEVEEKVKEEIAIEPPVEEPEELQELEKKPEELQELKKPEELQELKKPEELQELKEPEELQELEKKPEELQELKEPEELQEISTEIEEKTMSDEELEQEPKPEPQPEIEEVLPKTNSIVLIKTTLGDIRVELFSDQAPKTVENFLTYTKAKHYDGTVFHRVIDGFMVQGGGFTKDLVQKKTKDPIENEAENELRNDRGTLAMARTMEPHSATSQFFINVVDNPFLNFRSKTHGGYGYCVFGKVVEGMDVVDKIRKVKTTTQGHFQDVPVTPVEIIELKVVE